MTGTCSSTVSPLNKQDLQITEFTKATKVKEEKVAVTHHTLKHGKGQVEFSGDQNM